MTRQAMSIDPGSGRCLIVIPTLDEARHIGALLDTALREARELDARVVVADGGSHDGTLRIIEAHAAREPRLTLLHNPGRIQGAGINRAVAAFGGKAEFLLRIDAHGTYPPDYCRELVAEAERTGADAVVVALTTVGASLFQRAVAAAQNSFVGTGGSKHRTMRGGCWVEHGHHALMRIEAFRKVGGYDEAFRSNEDAELDYRLVQAGCRIWLTARTGMTYYPRSSPAALFRQYFGYGRGRARNILKHRAIPRARQVLPLLVVPALGLALLFPIHWLALGPLVLWLLATLAFGAWAATRQADPRDPPIARAPLVGLAAMIMHLAWSGGFWVHLLGSLGRRA